MSIQGRNRVQGRRPCVFFLVFWCGWWWLQVGFITHMPYLNAKMYILGIMHIFSQASVALDKFFILFII